MAISINQPDSEDSPIGNINTTPLVDVMLVLLIIFLITVPVVATSIPVRLPNERSADLPPKAGSLLLSVDVNAQLYWYDSLINSDAEMLNKLKAYAIQNPQAEVQIRGDSRATYEGAGRLMALCQRAGIYKITFVTEPSQAH